MLIDAILIKQRFFGRETTDLSSTDACFLEQWAGTYFALPTWDFWTKYS